MFAFLVAQFCTLYLVSFADHPSYIRCFSSLEYFASTSAYLGGIVHIATSLTDSAEVHDLG